MPTATATAVVTRSAGTTARATGRVLWFSPKGFGMIAAEDGGEVYVHHTGIVGDGFTHLPTDAQVSYAVSPTPRGPEAVDVVVDAVDLTRV